MHLWALQRSIMSQVVVDGSVGRTDTPFTFDTPVLTRIVGNTAHTGGSSLSVIGLNFNLVDLTPTISLASRSCSTASWTSLSHLVCLTQALETLTAYANVNLLTYGVVQASHDGTGVRLFTYDSPVTSRLSVTNGPHSAGTRTQMAGVNFAAVADVPLAASMFLHPCSTLSWSSQTSLDCTLAPRNCRYRYCGAFERTIEPRVSIDYLVGTSEVQFTFDAPVVSAVGSNLASTGGSPAWVSGINFGQEALSITAIVGDVLCNASLRSFF